MIDTLISLSINGERSQTIDPSETTRRLRVENILAKITIAYLQGILGDATYNKIHKTHRISQAKS